MIRFIIYIVAALTYLSGNAQLVGNQQYAKKNPDAQVIKLINGKWFNGTTFEEKTAWLHEGLLYFKFMHQKVDLTVDLQENYVIPPFAEAHNHNLESQYEIEKRIKSYLDNGVFYVKLLSSIKKRMDLVMHHYNQPSGLDVSMAHAPLTATDGHPMGVRKRYLDKGYFQGMFNNLKELEFHGYVTINSAEDLADKWDSIVSKKPDFIKVNLLYSERYEERKQDTTYFGRKGLNPKLIPEIVKKAHAANLRISAHVETAHDFHVAVTAGVDEIAHLPEISHGQPIDRADAKLAAEKGTIVVTTISLIKKRKELPNYQALVDNIASNLRILKEEGVTLAIGSDWYTGNSVGEFHLVREQGVFTNLELLTMWTKNATHTTFPKRKIGALKEGYEASFLVLNEDPLKNLSRIQETIVFRIKQGEILK